MEKDDKQSDERISDPTPISGAATDVSPLGRDTAKPAHELTADEDRDVVDWESAAASVQFKALVKAKLKFIVPATLFFIIYFFALPVMVGYAPDLMNRRVVGSVNVAYLFALSQFFMAWILAWLYIRRANTVFDPLAEAVRRRARAWREGRG